VELSEEMAAAGQELESGQAVSQNAGARFASEEHSSSVNDGTGMPYQRESPVAGKV
jgi:hypothetical protein